MRTVLQIGRRRARATSIADGTTTSVRTPVRGDGCGGYRAPDDRGVPHPLPAEVVRETSERYVTAYERISGKALADWYGPTA